MPTPEVPEVYTTSLETLTNEYRTDNKKFVEWFAKDKEKLINDIQRMRNNTYHRKVVFLALFTFLRTSNVSVEYYGQKSQNGEESCLCHAQTKTRTKQGIFSVNQKYF